MRVRKLMVQPTSAALSADAHGFPEDPPSSDPAARAWWSEYDFMLRRWLDVIGLA